MKKIFDNFITAFIIFGLFVSSFMIIFQPNLSFLTNDSVESSSTGSDLLE